MNWRCSPDTRIQEDFGPLLPAQPPVSLAAQADSLLELSPDLLFLLVLLLLVVHQKPAHIDGTSSLTVGSILLPILVPHTILLKVSLSAWGEEAMGVLWWLISEDGAGGAGGCHTLEDAHTPLMAPDNLLETAQVLPGKSHTFCRH